MKVVIIFVLAAGLMLMDARAGATPRPLPYTYPYETLQEGQLEVELYTDVIPLRVPASLDSSVNGNLWAPEYKLQTEIEYGLSDRVELGFYQVFDAAPVAGGDSPLSFDGLKWRVRTRLAEAGEWPVDVGLYAELETMHDELSLEGKVNLQRRFGNLRWMTNLWAEEVLSRPLDTPAQGRALHFVINPTTGFTFQVTPTFHPGIEFWARGQIAPTGDTNQERSNTRVHYFVGPVVHLNFGKLWWSAGVYVNLTDTSAPVPGDAYGPIWFRSVLGLEF